MTLGAEQNDTATGELATRMPGKAVSALKYVATNPHTQPFVANAAVEGIKAVHEGAGNLAAGVLDLVSADAEGDGLDNPMFEQNGHDGPSPATARYFTVKKALKIGGTLGVAMLDVGGFASGAEAVNSSVVWYRLNALFEQMIPPSRRAKAATYARTGWFSWEVANKAVSAGSLEIMMRQVLRQKMYSGLGSATKAGVTFGTGGLTGYFINSASSLIAPGLNALFGQDVQALAQGLHWFAYRESVVGQGVGKGPSMRILEAIWQQFAIGRTSGVTLAQITREPRGWLVVADLLA